MKAAVIPSGAAASDHAVTCMPLVPDLATSFRAAAERPRLVVMAYESGLVTPGELRP
jgi:hypothetical protein